MKNDKSKQPARKAHKSSSTTPTPSLPTIDSTTASDAESHPTAVWSNTNASSKAKDPTRGTDAGDTDISSHLEDSGKASWSDGKHASPRPIAAIGFVVYMSLTKTSSLKCAKLGLRIQHLGRTGWFYPELARSAEFLCQGQKVRIQMPDKEKPNIVARFLEYTEGSCSPMSYPLPSEELDTIAESIYFAVRWDCKGFGWVAVSAFEAMVSNQDMDTLRSTVKKVVSEFDNEAPEAIAVRYCLLYGLACCGEDILSDPLCRVRLRKFAGAPLTVLGELTRQRHFDARLPIYEVGQYSTELTKWDFKPRRSAAWDPFEGAEDVEARETKTGRERFTSVSSVSSSKS
ncbi:hypothetical protein KC316_g13172 [Hortaea werneckii]|nr:hypothetical protein KC324_g7763 [Hortaea werneckii]KAI7559201.1 hypothetical protein KC316_g13172 [Hortaea werneckii]